MTSELMPMPDASRAAAPAARGARAQDGTAWQQQLERAQASGWFCRADPLQAGEGTRDGPPAQGLDRHGGGRRPDAGTRAATAQQSLTSFTARLPHGVASAHPLAIGAVAATELPQLQAAIANRPTDAVLALVELAEVASVESPAPQAPDLPEPVPGLRTGATKEARPSIRVHVEDSLQGLWLWLGVDGAPAEATARASSVAAELRRQCERAGVRLAGVICNGAPVAGAAPIPDRSEEP